MATETGLATGPVRPPAEQRRRELAEAAAARFHELGFHGVALAQVAARVGVTAPAVYRHFRNKNALLAGAIGTGLDHIEAALADATTLADALDRLAEAALHRRDVWVLLQREIRHLDDRARRASTGRFRGLAERFTEHVRTARPDLDDSRVQVLVTAAYGVLASPSTRPLPLPHPAYRDALARMAAAACATALPDAGTSPTLGRDRRPDPRRSRSEQLLRTAIALFSRHGYAAVSVDDIGAATGVTGPSLYHHFPTKAELLLAAYDRAAGLLPAPRPDAADPLGDLVERYCALILRERDLFSVYVTEEINLPAGAASVRAAQHADTQRWITTLIAARPELRPVDAELLVHAARSAVHDLTRVGRLHTRPAITGDVVAVAGAVLSTRLDRTS